MVTRQKNQLSGDQTRICNPRDIRPLDYEGMDSIPSKLRHLLNYAVLAPSTHNTQPWLFRVSDKTIDVLADRSRALGVIDPDDKSLVMSCGVASGVLAMALEAVGFQFQVAHLPDSSEPDLISRFNITSEGERKDDWKETLNAIRLRRSVRAGYKNKVFQESELESILPKNLKAGCQIKLINSSENEVSVLNAILEAENFRQADKHYVRENASWINPIRRRSKDGIPTSQEKMPTLGQLWSPDAIFNQKGERLTLVGVFESQGNRTIQWIRSGFLMADVLVQASRMGMSAAIINHPLHIPSIYNSIERVISEGWTAQIIVRFGFAEHAPVTPRRSLLDVMLHPGFNT